MPLDQPLELIDAILFLHDKKNIKFDKKLMNGNSIQQAKCLPPYRLSFFVSGLKEILPHSQTDPPAYLECLLYSEEKRVHEENIRTDIYSVVLNLNLMISFASDHISKWKITTDELIFQLDLNILPLTTVLFLPFPSELDPPSEQAPSLL